MKKILSEELVLPSSLNLQNLDITAIKNIKTDSELLTDINYAAGQQSQTAIIKTSNGNSVGITNFLYQNNHNIDVSKVKEDAAYDSDYSRVKYFTTMLKNKGYVLNSTGKKSVNWSDGKLTVTKTDDKTNKSETKINSVVEPSKEDAQADDILKRLTSDAIGKLSPLAKKSVKNPNDNSVVKEEINRIKQLMK